MTPNRWHSDPLIEEAIEAIEESHPYYLSAVERLRITADPSVPTMATSASWVTHYNPTFAKSITAAERGAVLVHELEHLLRRHHERCADRDPGRFNIAGDAEINQRLAGLPSGAVYPESIGMPRGRTAEVYYGATEAPQPKPEEGEGEGSGGAPGDGQPAKCGSAAGGPTQAHEAGDARNPGAGAADGGRQARRKVAENVLARGIGRGTEAGDELREWAEAEVGIDRSAWYAALASAVGHVMAPFGAPTRWQWPGRRDIRDMGGAMVPRWTGERPQCAVVIDTSGSITPFDLDMAAAAGHYIARMAEVTFYACDTRATRLGSVLPPRLGGGGGTDMTVGIEMAIAEGARAVVVITDCQTPWPQAYAGVPLIVGANPGAMGVLASPGHMWYPPEWATVLPVVRP